MQHNENMNLSIASKHYRGAIQQYYKFQYNKLLNHAYHGDLKQEIEGTIDLMKQKENWIHKFVKIYSRKVFSLNCNLKLNPHEPELIKG